MICCTCTVQDLLLKAAVLAGEERLLGAAAAGDSDILLPVICAEIRFCRRVVRRGEPDPVAVNTTGSAACIGSLRSPCATACTDMHYTTYMHLHICTQVHFRLRTAVATQRWCPAGLYPRQHPAHAASGMQTAKYTLKRQSIPGRPCFPAFSSSQERSASSSG